MTKQINMAKKGAKKTIKLQGRERERDKFKKKQKTNSEMPDPRSAVTDIPIPRFPFLGGLLPLRLGVKAAEKKGTRERNGGPGNEEWRPGLRFRQCYSAEFIVIGVGR